MGNILNAHAIGAGRFEVLVQFIPTVVCTEVEFPQRSRVINKHRGGNMAREAKSQSGHYSFGDLILRGVTSYELTDALMYTYVTGAAKLPPMGVVITIILMDNLPRPRKTWTYIGCQLRDDQPNGLTAGSEDNAGFELIFEVEDLLEQPSI